MHRALHGKPSVKAFGKGCFVTSHRDYEEVIINTVFVHDKNRLWIYNTTSAKIFFG